jgi:ankyrin repeat protein
MGSSAGQLETIELLLNRKANIEAKCDGSTAFYYTAEKKNVAELLLSYGANINAKNALGQTALIRISNLFGFEQVRAQILQFLLDKGADIKAKDDYGKTALDYLKQNIQDSESIKLLISWAENEYLDASIIETNDQEVTSVFSFFSSNA